MEGVNVMFGSPVNFVEYELSKVEILRAIVTEKMTTAAREIFAVVERTVSGYEEEAAGLRQEIDRQRVQLEAILQPRVSLSRIEEPSCEEEVDWEDGDDSGSFDIFSHTEEDLRGGRFAKDSFGPLYHDDVKDLDYQSPGRRHPSLKKRSRKRPYVNIRVCLLKDSNINVRKRGALKSQLKEVRCPPGLQEADFLDLLRASFPQLTEDFDLFTMDTGRNLTQLKLEKLTAEEIERSIKSTGKGRSALYIRAKTLGETLSTERVEDLTSADRRQAEDGPHGSSLHSPAEGEDHPSTTFGRHRIKMEDDGDFRGVPSAHVIADSSSEDGDNEGEEDDRDKDWKPKEEELKEERAEPHSSTEKKTQVKSSGAPPQKKKRIRPSQRASTDSSVPLFCKVCKGLLGTDNMLIKHSWSHVDDPDRLCGVCGEQSASVEELKSHLESHKKTYSCDTCGKKFLSVLGLRTHGHLHTGDKPFKCDICEKGFVLSKSLKNHRLEHMEDKPHKCEVCNKSFALKAKLKIHNRIHTGEKPYSCNLCNKTFSDSGPLSRHKLTHRGEKRFSCQICGKLFFTPRELNFHSRIHTNRDKSHLCDICCKTFYTQGHLNEHLKIHSDEKFICTECGRSLSSKGALKRHMMVHSGERPFECLQCGRTYTSSSHLRFHLKLHAGIKSNVCQVCGKAFLRKEALNNHMRTHDGEKPHKCTICGRGFTQSHSMKTHMKRHLEKSEVDFLMD